MPSSNDAVAFHSEIARDFRHSYDNNPNRLDRVQVWRTLIARYCAGAELAYDIGCGSGDLTCVLARSAKAVVGVDGAEGMLRMARENSEKQHLSNITFRQARLPFAPDESFVPGQFVMSSSVLEYLDSLSEGIATLSALAAPGAAVIFSISNKESYSRRLVQLVHRVTGKPAYFGHLKHFIRPADIPAILAGTSLSFEEYLYSDGASRVSRLMARMAPASKLNNMLVVVCRKK